MQAGIKKDSEEDKRMYLKNKCLKIVLMFLVNYQDLKFEVREHFDSA